MHGSIIAAGATPSPVRFVAVGSWRADRGQDAPAHRHGAWKITHYTSGRIDSIVDGRIHRTAPGTVLVLPPYAAHTELARTAYTNDYLLVDAPDDQPWPERCDGSDADLIGTLLGALARQRPTGDDPRELEVRDRLVATVDALLLRRRVSAGMAPAEVVVREAEQILEAEHATGVSITALAGRVGVSPSTLRDHFRRLRGRGPLETLRDVRSRHALDLLHTSDLTLDSIAERCGFASASHLGRVIKERTGLSPGSWRRRFGPGEDAGIAPHR